MNKQEIFNTVVRHLLTQNAKSQRGEKCYYRDGQGRACAVGCLIKEENYDGHLEGGNVYSAYVDRALEASLGRELEPDDCCLLSALQRAHDLCAVEHWPENLRAAAYMFGLSPAVIEELRPEARVP